LRAKLPESEKGGEEKEPSVEVPHGLQTEMILTGRCEGRTVSTLNATKEGTKKKRRGDVFEADQSNWGGNSDPQKEGNHSHTG